MKNVQIKKIKKNKVQQYHVHVVRASSQDH